MKDKISRKVILISYPVLEEEEIYSDKHVPGTSGILHRSLSFQIHMCYNRLYDFDNKYSMKAPAERVLIEESACISESSEKEKKKI